MSKAASNSGARAARSATAFSALEARVGYVLHRTDLLHMEAMSRLLEEIGLTPARATALSLVKGNPGTGQTTLAQALGINRASAMEVVNHLEALGALERRPGNDKRSNALHLTAKGNKLYGAFIEATLEVDQLIAADLTAEEFTQLAELLARVRASLGRQLGAPQSIEE
jgi:DNA-binding MarR family transcriptional regulator